MASIVLTPRMKLNRLTVNYDVDAKKWLKLAAKAVTARKLGLLKEK